MESWSIAFVVDNLGSVQLTQLANCRRAGLEQNRQAVELEEGVAMLKEIEKREKEPPSKDKRSERKLKSSSRLKCHGQNMHTCLASRCYP